MIEPRVEEDTAVHSAPEGWSWVEEIGEGREKRGRGDGRWERAEGREGGESKKGGRRSGSGLEVCVDGWLGGLI